MTDRGPLLIVGASGRAAAMAALRAGWRPFVIDLFRDADLDAIAPGLRCPFEGYPVAFVELARQAPPGPWLYTGALENYPDVIETIARDRPLLGNGLAVIAEVRDPFRLAQIIPDNVPAISETVPANGRWLLKPKAGAAGIGVRDAVPGEAMPAGGFAQAFVAGPAMSALFIDGDLLGVTRQLIGTDFLHAPPFRYAGNVGPLPGEATDDLRTIGERLVRATGLRGDWGIDFIRDADGVARVLEVNPRPTAARELFDLAAMDDVHRVYAKGIFYAPRRIVWPADGPWNRPVDLWQRPDFADVPQPGAVHEPGQPVITLLVDGANDDDCVAQLRQRAERLLTALA